MKKINIFDEIVDITQASKLVNKSEATIRHALLGYYPYKIFIEGKDYKKFKSNVIILKSSLLREYPENE